MFGGIEARDVPGCGDRGPDSPKPGGGGGGEAGIQSMSDEEPGEGGGHSMFGGEAGGGAGKSGIDSSTISSSVTTIGVELRGGGGEDAIVSYKVTSALVLSFWSFFSLGSLLELCEITVALIS